MPLRILKRAGPFFLSHTLSLLVSEATADERDLRDFGLLADGLMFIKRAGQELFACSRTGFLLHLRRLRIDPTHNNNVE